MYGLEKDTDLSFLVNETLCQLRAGQYQLSLHFDNGAMISIESEISHTTNGHVHTWQAEGNKDISTLFALLGENVTDAQIQDANCLVLLMADGSMLQIRDTNEDAESFEIHFGECSIIV